MKNGSKSDGSCPSLDKAQLKASEKDALSSLFFNAERGSKRPHDCEDLAPVSPLSPQKIKEEANRAVTVLDRIRAEHPPTFSGEQIDFSRRTIRGGSEVEIHHLRSRQTNLVRKWARDRICDVELDLFGDESESDVQVGGPYDENDEYDPLDGEKCDEVSHEVRAKQKDSAFADLLRMQGLATKVRRTWESHLEKLGLGPVRKSERIKPAYVKHGRPRGTGIQIPEWGLDPVCQIAVARGKYMTDIDAVALEFGSLPRGVYDKKLRKFSSQMEKVLRVFALMRAWWSRESISVECKADISDLLCRVRKFGDSILMRDRESGDYVFNHVPICFTPIERLRELEKNCETYYIPPRFQQIGPDGFTVPTPDCKYVIQGWASVAAICEADLVAVETHGFMIDYFYYKANKLELDRAKLAQTLESIVKNPYKPVFP
jgi:hypothetical protein